MSRSEPIDEKTAISTSIETLKKLETCSNAVSFCRGKEDIEVITPSKAVDGFTVQELLFGIDAIKTREDTVDRLKNIARACYSGYSDSNYEGIETLLEAYEASSLEASDKDANDEKWKTAIINEFRE